MNIINKTLTIIFLSLVFMLNISLAQHSHNRHSDHESGSVIKQKTEKSEELPSGLSQMPREEYKADKSKSGDKHSEMEDHNMNMDSSNSEKVSFVREGEIDLKEIDKNNDGKVYQDTMDWNVISDEPGECPLCGMKLKEVTLEKAKDNLIEHNFKVKV